MRHHQVASYNSASSGRRHGRTHKRREQRRLKRQLRLQENYPAVTTGGFAPRRFMFGGAGLIALLGVGAISFAVLKRRNTLRSGNIVSGGFGATSVIASTGAKGWFGSKRGVATSVGLPSSGLATGIPTTGLSTGIASGVPTTGFSAGIASGIPSSGLASGIPTTGVTTTFPSSRLATGIPSTGLTSGIASRIPKAGFSTGVASRIPSSGLTSGIPSTGLASGIPRSIIGKVPLLGKLLAPKALPVAPKRGLFSFLRPRLFKPKAPGMTAPTKRSKLPFILPILLPLLGLGGLLLGLNALRKKLFKRKPKVLVPKKAPVVVAPQPMPVPAPIPVAQPVLAKRSRFPLFRAKKATKVVPTEQAVPVAHQPAYVHQAPVVRHTVRTQYVAPPVQQAEIIEEVPVKKTRKFSRRYL